MYHYLTTKSRVRIFSSFIFIIEYTHTWIIFCTIAANWNNQKKVFFSSFFYLVKNSLMKHVPWSHRRPVQPVRHLHWNPPRSFDTQRPFRHGLCGAHGSFRAKYFSKILINFIVANESPSYLHYNFWQLSLDFDIDIHISRQASVCKRLQDRKVRLHMVKIQNLTNKHIQIK